MMMNKFRYCKICGQTPLDCDFLKAEEVCNDADLYNQGYEKAFEEVADYLDDYIDNYQGFDNEGFVCVDTLRLRNDLIKELLNKEEKS